jgi:hypothetical protein
LLHLEEAVRVAQVVGDPHALPPWLVPSWRLFLIHRETAHAHLNLGAIDHARESCARMLAVPPPAGPERLVIHELPYFIAVYAGEYDEARIHLEREGQLIEELALERERLLWANNMADLDVLSGREADARRLLAEQCEGYIAQGDVDLLQIVLDTFASAVGVLDPVLSARAFGASGSIRAAESLPVPERERTINNAMAERVAAVLGPQRCEAELAAGARADVATLLRELSARSLSS